MDEMDPDMPKVPRRGRRARPEAAAIEEPQDGPQGGEPLDPNDPAALFGESARPDSRLGDETLGDSAVPPPPRRGGFDMSFNDNELPSPTQQRPPPPSGPADPLADDAGGKKFFGVSRRAQDQRQREQDEKKRAIDSKYENATVDGIMEIPELEEEGKEDLSRVVAEAPKVRTNKVQDLSELDQNMQYKLPTNDDRDMDLSLLTAVLCSSVQVEEPDDVWDADVLFSNVASELYQEREKAEGVVPEGDTGAMDIAGALGSPEQAVI